MTNESIKPQNRRRGIGNSQDYLNTQIPVKENFSNSYSSPVLSLIEQTTITGKTPNVQMDMLARTRSLTQETKKGESFTFSLLDDIKELRELKTTTHQLLDIMLMATCAKVQNGIPPTIEMSVKEFMEYRNLADRKHAMGQLKKDLDALYSASISYQPAIDSKAEQLTKPFADVRIIGFKSAANGKFSFRLDATFFEKVLSVSSIIPKPICLCAINSKKAPTAYYIGLKFTQTKYMNAGKATENKISTQSIMRCLPNILSMEEVRQKDRNYFKHIIDPIETGLNELVQCGMFKEWYYVDAQGKRFESSSFNYNDFQDLCVQVEWANYPYDSAIYKKRLETNARKEKATKAKRTRTKKPKTEN